MKKALFITYFWPPSGKASLLQPLRIASYLKEFGIEPTVVTVEEDRFNLKDETLLSQIPESLKVEKTKAWEPFSLYRKALNKPADSKLVASETISSSNSSFAHRASIWIRMNLFVPDARIGWYFYAVSKCKELLSKGTYDYIITNGPPHSAHLIGRKISKLYNIPHITIFIDPWVDIAYYKGLKRNRLTVKLDNKFEKTVVENAKLNFFVTEELKKYYINKYPSLANTAEIMHWGYDVKEFDKITRHDKSSDSLTIVHSGNIFDYQNPIKLWEEISTQINSGIKIQIKFIGTVSPGIKNSIKDFKLDAYTKYLGFLSYREMLSEVVNADFLLVCATEKRHLPGKLFEYLHTGNPIIAFAEENPELERILSELNSGMVFTYDISPKPFFDNISNFKPKKELALKYDRKSLTQVFAKTILNKLP